MRPLLSFARVSRSWWLVLCLLLAQLTASAQNLPPRPNPPRLVNDLAGMLQPQQVEQLERKLVAYNDSTSSQIAIVTVPTLGDYDIAGYTQQLYESWGIGQKNNNNGVLILVAEQERKVRIQPGYGLEGAIPDALAKRIITSTLTPAFKENRYYEGLDRATDQLIALAKGEYKADPATQPRAQRGREDSSGSGISFWVIIALLILFILFRNRGGGSGGRRNRGFGGAMIPPIIFGDFSGGRGVFGGGGGSWGGGGGGGGFGGFGGGSSGGGGASGDW
ncbi:TPM domain-containing protein [Hymenobacter endophyticus]|uniref:TPM domain-containing protein n=1 Tax=Hymenobacter endophyticus TaxID=3076335 RepID=A0ABU3THE5_9BACT|nr:TPM domain-containing protein [Hymenobacter endophyticus]MDU0370798.1 TPM domain-containing protein [Hymenobacter endophyticus]